MDDYAIPEPSKETNLIRKLLLAVLVLPFCAVLFAGQAQAAPNYDKDSLSNLLLTKSELSDVMDAVGVTEKFAIASDGSGSPGGLVNVARVFLNNDSALGIDLYADPAGTVPTGKALAAIQDGSFLRDAMNTIFDNTVTDWDHAPFGIADDDSDYLVAFAAKRDGSDYKVIADSQVKGGVVAIVFYATTTSGDQALEIIGGLYGGQQAKLP